MSQPVSTLRLEQFDYEFPQSLIAQRPLSDRASSRLLVVDRDAQSVSHGRFRDLLSLIDPGDGLVVNTTRVFKARLKGKRDTGSPAEVLLVRENTDGSWLAMVYPAGKLKPGRRVTFGPNAHALIEGVTEGGLRRVRFSGMEVTELCRRMGSTPLPPYIERTADEADEIRYQTVYAAAEGSVAAPTAGLHFDREMLDELEDRGVERIEIVLHVGPGTFRPVEVENLEQHHMHEEPFVVSPEAASRLNRVRQRGGRIWSVGTTVARALESATQGGEVKPQSGSTNLFIRPPYEFEAVDCLLTNFHLPRSTLLMLVAAFAGHNLTMRAYREAVRQRYRLFSYGDAMLIL